MAIEIDYMEIEERLGITEEDRKHIRDNPPNYSTETFYNLLKNINYKNLPPQVQLSELMEKDRINEGHPMYNELIEKINSAVENELRKEKERGWTHPKYRIPITKMEWVVDFLMTFEEMKQTRIIPEEYYHIREKFLPNHNIITFKK
jgi:hypothetical protein